MRQPDLSCCPFCGGPARMAFLAHEWGYRMERCCVECSWCGAASEAFYTHSKEARNLAKDAWNRRYYAADLCPSSTVTYEHEEKE